MFIQSLKKNVKKLISATGLKVSQEKEFLDLRTNNIGLTASSAIFAHCVKYPELLSDETLRDFIDFATTNYTRSCSQWSQDLFAAYILRDKQQCRYLEVGGADGITHSNTISLRDWLGWDGVLIEPDPWQFQDLKKNRGASDITLNVALSSDNSNSYLQLIQVGQLSSIEGFHGHDIHAAMREKAFLRNGSIKVQAVNINRVFEEYGPFNYFSLDVEGYETPLLRAYDGWHKADAPEVITVECNFRDKDEIAVTEILKEAGYNKYFAEHKWLTRGDLWFAKAST